MAWKRVKRGAPFTFHEFAFFSPKQFDENVEIEEKDFLFKLKICIDTGKVATGPFFGEVVGEEFVCESELKKMLEIVYKTPNIIIYGEEYVIHDDYNQLWRYYGGKPSLVFHEQLAQ
jgi:hypothetical protein